MPCNVTDEAQVQQLYDTAVSEHGRIDVAVNNAGLGGKAEIVEMTDEQWSTVLDITLTGTFRCMRAELRHMYGQGSGVIVNNASVLGWRAQAGQAHYAAAKAGVMALTRCAAVEARRTRGAGQRGVARAWPLHPFLNRVCPTRSSSELRAGEVFGRAAETWEVANVMVFLASDTHLHERRDGVGVEPASLSRGVAAAGRRGSAPAKPGIEQGGQAPGLP